MWQDWNGNNYLHRAVIDNNVKDVNLLLSCFKDAFEGGIIKEEQMKKFVNMKNNDEETALHIAASKSCTPIMDLILKTKVADLNIRNNLGKKVQDIYPDLMTDSFPSNEWRIEPELETNPYNTQEPEQLDIHNPQRPVSVASIISISHSLQRNLRQLTSQNEAIRSLSRTLESLGSEGPNPNPNSPSLSSNTGNRGNNSGRE
jgi:ankyrin repeat protein